VPFFLRGFHMSSPSSDSPTLAPTPAASDFTPTDAQHADLLEQFLRQDLSICGLAARFERSPADIARWANSPRTLSDLAAIDQAMSVRTHFHELASRTAAQQLLTKLCYTRGRPEFTDPSDKLFKDDHLCLDRAQKSAAALLRHGKSDRSPSQRDKQKVDSHQFPSQREGLGVGSFSVHPQKIASRSDNAAPRALPAFPDLVIALDHTQTFSLLISPPAHVLTSATLPHTHSDSWTPDLSNAKVRVSALYQSDAGPEALRRSGSPRSKLFSSQYPTPASLIARAEERYLPPQSHSSSSSPNQRPADLPVLSTPQAPSPVPLNGLAQLDDPVPAFTTDHEDTKIAEQRQDKPQMAPMNTD
jgi:hypothetical protein